MNKGFVTYREAIKSDWEAIAQLHTVNWQENYRGSFSDQYLDYEAMDDRNKVWRNRLMNPSENQHILIAENDDNFAGFSCSYSHYKDGNRHYMDNLHVNRDLRGKKIGANLLYKSAKWAFSIDSRSDFYLLVLEDNTKGIKFYERMGASLSDPYLTTTPEGSNLKVIECIWSSMDQIII